MQLPDDDFDDLPELPPSRTPLIVSVAALAIAVIAALVTWNIAEETQRTRAEIQSLRDLRQEWDAARAALASRSDFAALANAFADLRHETGDKLTALQAEEAAVAHATAEQESPEVRPPDTADGRPLVEK